MLRDTLFPLFLGCVCVCWGLSRVVTGGMVPQGVVRREQGRSDRAAGAHACLKTLLFWLQPLREGNGVVLSVGLCWCGAAWERGLVALLQQQGGTRPQ
eukprot:2337394-Rhodomonas_salina.1